METNFIHIGGRQKVNPEEIMMLQAEVNYTVLFFKNGKKCIVATCLKSLEARFKPFNFFRSHKSYLVNLDCVKCYLKPHNQLQMVDDKRIMVSRRKMIDLKKCLMVE